MRCARTGESFKNVLELSRGEFVRALRSFRPRSLGDVALLACEGGYLSIESGGQVVTMHATGEWHGRAWISSNMIKALAAAPPRSDPVTVAYSDGQLRVGSTTIGCQWEPVSEAFLRSVANPAVLDYLAMDRSMPRSEVNATDLANRIRGSKAKLARDIRRAAKVLAHAEILEEDLWALVERGIRRRLASDKDG